MSRNSPSGGESVFELVSDPSVKMRLLYDLIRSGQNITAKTVVTKAQPEHSEIVHLKPTAVRGHLLIAQVTPAGSSPAGLIGGGAKNSELILHFQVGEEKYITQVPFTAAGENLQLSMERKLFRVQRREFFRLHLPASFRGHLEIEATAGAAASRKLALMDLSAGGCRVRTKLDDLQPNRAFDAVLKIPGRADFHLKATIRHRSLVADRSGDTAYGIQFTYASLAESSRMSATVLDLYREYFSRL